MAEIAKNIIEIPENVLTRHPQNLNHISIKKKHEFLNSFDMVFCDCDGVIWDSMQKPIKHINKGIEFLRNSGKRIVFVTNNSVRTMDEHLKKFHDNQIHVNKLDIIHPVQTIIEYFNKIQFNSKIYVIANQAFQDELKRCGYDVIDGPNIILDENFQELNKHIFDKHDIGAVVIDVDFNLNIAKLIRAQLYLKKNPNCLLIGGAADSFVSFGNTDVSGPGLFLDIIEKSVFQSAKVFGKPGNDLADMLKERFNIIQPERILFIGDSLEADISFGRKNKFQTLAVLTGQTNLQTLQNLTIENLIPDYFIESLADFQNFL